MHLRLSRLGTFAVWAILSASADYGMSKESPVQLQEPNPETTITPPPQGIDPFYSKYMLAGGVHILGTPAASDWAVRKVHEIVTHMLSSLNDQSAVARFRGAKMVVMNAADRPTIMPYLEILGPDFRRQVETNYRGFSAGHALTVVTEEMMCKNGVATRGNSDTAYRRFDQVVHEWAHTMESVLGLIGRTDQLAPQTNLSAFWKANPREMFAMLVQTWFAQNYSYENGRFNSRMILRNTQAVANRYIAEILRPNDAWIPVCQ